MKENPLVLVIDDDPDILTMIRVMLEYNNYQVVVAENEEETFDQLRNNKVDLVIMDMLLSGIDGTDICFKIRKDPDAALVPVLMFSAHPHAKEICLASGANDFIAKPFEMQEMLKKVKENIENTALKAG
jgi:DNA-binding response OmpR family regulator